MRQINNPTAVCMADSSHIDVHRSRRVVENSLCVDHGFKIHVIGTKMHNVFSRQKNAQRISSRPAWNCKDSTHGDHHLDFHFICQGPAVQTASICQASGLRPGHGWGPTFARSEMHDMPLPPRSYKNDGSVLGAWCLVAMCLVKMLSFHKKGVSSFPGTGLQLFRALVRSKRMEMTEATR